MSSDFAKTIEAKSDQLNSDDLMAGPITVTITDVKVNTETDQQPVAISFTGDNGKPWKPSKSMRRALILKWGSDEKVFIGRSLTLFRDPTIRWAGQEVGGVSISHMTDMSDDTRFLLTSSRGQKKAMKIEHLKVKTPEEIAAEKMSRASVWVSQSKLEIRELTTVKQVQKWRVDKSDVINSLDKYNDLSCELAEIIECRINELEGAQ